MNVELVPSSAEQQPVLANLFELYAHDFSAFINLELGADGRFGYDQLPLYWKESSRYPFLIKVNGQLAGFVFVCKGSHISDDDDTWDMTEFFVVRRYRGLGVGMKAAHEVWKQLPGRWEVRVMDSNKKAGAFWRRAVGAFLGKTNDPIAFEKNGEGWHVFSFESSDASSA